MRIYRILYNAKEYYATKNRQVFLLYEASKLRNDLGIEKFILGEQLPEPNLSINIQKEEFSYLPPIARPGKVICIGRNYKAHSEEQGRKTEDRPLLFSKYSSNLVGHNAMIPKPTHGDALDYEVELAVIIGKQATKVVENGLKYVYGFTTANDLTLRDIQKSDPGKQWTRGKAFDASLPFGPATVSRDEIADPQNLGIWLTVNGERRQESNTKNMIYSIDYLIQYISQAITLQPGDVILTGTPAGVGYFMDPVATLEKGDEIACGVETVGELRFRII